MASASIAVASGSSSGQAALLLSRAAELGAAGDHAVALALLAGDEAAGPAAWLRFSGMVRRIVRRTLGQHQDAEDVVQDVFLRVFQQIASLRDARAFRAFVIAIAVRAAQHHLRQAGSAPVQAHAGTGSMADEVRASADVESQHAWLRFDRVLGRIRERDRTVFVLRFIEGRKLEEIAHLLGTSKPTIQRRLARAKERVRFFAERDVFLIEYACREDRRAFASSAQNCEKKLQIDSAAKLGGV